MGLPLLWGLGVSGWWVDGWELEYYGGGVSTDGEFAGRDLIEKSRGKSSSESCD